MVAYNFNSQVLHSPAPQRRRARQCRLRPRPADELHHHGFVTPPFPYTYGNFGRNVLRGPDLVVTDFSLFKNVPFRERAKFQFRGEFFNFFNTPRFGNPNSTFGTSSLGTIGSTSGNNRQIQFGAKLIF